ncbi:AlpA family phage regulatory protein [Acidovorax sp. SUPP950]|uniref:helix-turn-helix transcriptional regulator n=1 Tax=Acidovorax sp. SUPP950 TaxID=511901 RepID=UPI0024E15BC6|nr:AlpA family phage regulatory protein [Acidovorax sp. SUPP950]
MQTSIAIHPVLQPSGPVSAAAPQQRVERLLRLQDVRLMTGLGKSSIYAAIQAGKFPSPVNLTHHAVA